MIRKAAIGLIAFWRRCASPWLPPACRFYPSCSVYAGEAISSQGVLRGLWLTINRLSRCHPFNAGGVDLPPGPEASQP